MEYEVKLEIFEGPLDLLLHLIHKNEVDIFDIPIATITDQYLAYLDLMKALNINVAGDFLVMASTLIHIKSKMLLPVFCFEGEDEEDPRLEITRPLLEYMHFKEVAAELSERDILSRDVFSRPVAQDLMRQALGEEQQLDVNLFQLVDAFKQIVEQRLPGAQLTFRPERWSVKEKAELILGLLRERGTLRFEALFSEDKTLEELIVTFLSILELVHMGLVKVFQSEPETDIMLYACFEREAEGEHG